MSPQQTRELCTKLSVWGTFHHHSGSSHNGCEGFKVWSTGIGHGGIPMVAPWCLQPRCKASAPWPFSWKHLKWTRCIWIKTALGRILFLEAKRFFLGTQEWWRLWLITLMKSISDMSFPTLIQVKRRFWNLHQQSPLKCRDIMMTFFMRQIQINISLWELGKFESLSKSNP